MPPQTVHRICISVRLAMGLVRIVDLILAFAWVGQLTLPSYSALVITCRWKRAIVPLPPVARGANPQANRASLPETDEMAHERFSACAKHHSGTPLPPDTCHTFVSDSSPCLAS